MTPLRAIRDSLRLSRATVATALKIDYSHLYEIERGSAQASPDLANRLEVYFEGKITRDEILYPQDYPAAEKKPVRSVPGKKAASSVAKKKPAARATAGSVAAHG